MEPMNRLGTYVQDRMEELGLSARALAEESGGRLSESAVYMIRRGERSKLQPDTWLALSDVLKVPVEALLRLSPPEGQPLSENGGAPVAGTPLQHIS